MLYMIYGRQRAAINLQELLGEVGCLVSITSNIVCFTFISDPGP